MTSNIGAKLLLGNTKIGFEYGNEFEKQVSFIDKLMMVFVLLGRYFVLFNGVFFESMRIAYYFDLFIVIYTPRSLAFIKNWKNRLSYKFVYVGLAFLYWLYYIMYIGGYGTNVISFNI